MHKFQGQNGELQGQDYAVAGGCRLVVNGD